MNIKITKKHILASYDNLAKRAKLDLDFIILTIAASSICAFGFKMDSSAVIVGAMVISPLIYSVVSIGAASFKMDLKTFSHGLLTLFVGLFVAILMSTIINLFSFTNHGSEIINRLINEQIDYFFVAFFCGLAGTFAYFWPKLVAPIVGIAISVALIPPVVLVGIGLASLDYQLVVSSSTIVAINILGIYMGSVIMFAILYLLAKDN